MLSEVKTTAQDDVYPECYCDYHMVGSVWYWLLSKLFVNKSTYLHVHM